MSGINGSRSKDWQDREGQNDISGSEKENEDGTIEQPIATQQPTWTREAGSTQEPPLKRARRSILTRPHTVKPSKPTENFTSRLVESLPISPQPPTGQITGATQGYAYGHPSPRAVNHAQFTHQNAAVGPSYVQHQPPYPFQPQMDPRFVTPQGDAFGQFQASIPQPGAHSYSQNQYQNGYLTPQLTWVSSTPNTLPRRKIKSLYLRVNRTPDVSTFICPLNYFFKYTCTYNFNNV